jgi:hypothetical protein
LANVAVSTNGGLARGIRRVLSSRKIRGAAGGDDDPAAAALQHSRDDGSAAQMHAEDVRLENAPPVDGFNLPGGALLIADSRVGDQQLHCPCLRNRSLDGGWI